MSLAITIFFAQAAMVFLLGFQSLSVHARHYALAAGGSLMLGVTGYQITAIIAQMDQGSVGSLVWWSYIIAGPIGITLSMYLHPRLKSWLCREKPAKCVPPLTEGTTLAEVKQQ